MREVYVYVVPITFDVSWTALCLLSCYVLVRPREDPHSAHSKRISIRAQHGHWPY